MNKKGSKVRLENGIILKERSSEKFRVENRRFLGKYLKKSHRESGVPQNVSLFYKKPCRKPLLCYYFTPPINA